ncbi:SGNH/GDSL hydrolase family protein [Butyrivibrio sp. AE3004]|uniref:SGNH/GDSL hydrolase family protein n=1 Tax=Butyrivibrio sp. AE3004 TaxID=1506994 RepID=UPI000494C9E6|nr:SGNH/GDSL hydrolase family protein [Butyrivibrio sp. AE3004]
MKRTGNRNTKTKSAKPLTRIIFAVSLLLVAVLIAEFVAVIMDSHLSALAKTEEVKVVAEKKAVAAKEIVKTSKAVNTIKTIVAEEADKTSDDSKSLNLLKDNSTQAEYKITVFEEEKNLYSNDRVNIRSGAGTEFDKVGVIGKDTKVKVLGQTDNGWYQVMIGDEVGYISCDYLQEDEPGIDFIFAGDSRTVQMSQAVKEDEYEWIAKVGEGYNFFSSEAVPQIDESVGEGSVIIINYGVNDLYNVEKYIALVNKKADSWIRSGAKVFYAAVTPVSNYPTITNDDIENFNKELKSGLDSRIGWLDGYSYLQNNGFSTGDGLHYNNATYESLYKYYMNQIASAKEAFIEEV